MKMKRKMKRNKKFSSFILCMVLIVAMALSATGCNGSSDNGTPSTVQAEKTGSSTRTETAVLGEGSTSFAFTVVDKDGNETQFETHTDKEIAATGVDSTPVTEGESYSFKVE